MNNSVWMIGALAAALAGSEVQAHPAAYGPSYLPPAPYAAAGYGYTDVQCKRHSLRLLGARAGVTVLGLDADLDTTLRVGAGERCRRTVVYAPPPVTVPAPPPQAVYAAPYGQGPYGHSPYEPHYRW
jgi:hypothetical protein